MQKSHKKQRITALVGKDRTHGISEKHLRSGIRGCTLGGMRIHVLAENTSCSPEMEAEHGLSLLIETDGKQILFDTGASPLFAANAARLGQNMAAVKIAILSHGHYDHGGGLAHFLSINTHAPVWVSPHAFDRHFNAQGKDIGIAPHLQQHPRIITAPERVTELAPGITLHPACSVPTPYPPTNTGMSACVQGRTGPDDFRHEQYLLIEEDGLRYLFSGCSHRGILNIAVHFRADVLIGGFHFMKLDARADANLLTHAAGVLHTLPTRYFTGHCTGAPAFQFLKEHLGDQLQAITTGQTLNF